jgi:hypothetical protein
MPESPEESILARLRPIYTELARRQALSDEAQEEVRGHLEDKLLGYINGQIRITPDDALLLVRAHFGDASGVAQQIRSAQATACPPAWRHRMLVKSAMITAVLTLLGLPLAFLMCGGAAGTPSQQLELAVLMGGCLIVGEAGVLLAGRADPRSRWQRAVAALFMLPAIALILMFLAEGGHTFATHWIQGYTTRGGEFLFAATGTICLLGHALLILLLAVPIRQPHLSARAS